MNSFLILKISQVIVFSGIFVTITLPIITKIYDASTLGKYQLLISIITSLGVISSLKYEMAIILPKTDAIAKKYTHYVIMFKAASVYFYSFFCFLWIIIFSVALMQIV